jgi:hypothetical protein
MKASIRAAIVSVLVLLCSSLASAKHKSEVTDDHYPVGGKGATYQVLVIDSDDPRIQGPGKCGAFFLGGFALGHPDPRLTNPNAVCGHGIVSVRGHGIDTGRPPISVLPVEAPIPAAPGAEVTMDSAQIIRDLLPRLDKSEGDKMPVVLQIRNSILFLDARNSGKTPPKRVPKDSTSRPAS